MIYYQTVLFCPVSIHRFYIGCDRCQNWYHGRCVGILQSEANHIDVYVCPQCQSTEDAMTVLTPLTDKDYDGLKRILRSLQVCSSIANIYVTIINVTLLKFLNVYIYVNELLDNLPAIKVIMHV